MTTALFRTNHACWLALLLCLVSRWGCCQVENDDIARRIELQMNAAPRVSSTRNCTVQWTCVNEKLTGKCIEYHNDQWFWFRPPADGTYYINVQGQDCRDIRGVQLVVLEGEACHPDTYRILSCTSLATQDDIFVTLKGLQAGHAYLLNVDGYLNDFCRFYIGVSTQARGLPAYSERLAGPPPPASGQRVVSMPWSVSDSLGESLVEYRVYRRFEREKKSHVIRELPHERNTRGESLLDYQIADTVEAKGIYYYQGIGLRNDRTPVRLWTREVNYQPDTLSTDDYIVLRVNYALNTPLTLLIMDANRERLLQKNELMYQRKGLGIRLYVGRWRQQGIYRFKIKVNDNLKNTTKEYVFDTRVPD